MIKWIPVTGSTRIIAEAYDPETETINIVLARELRR